MGSCSVSMKKSRLQITLQDSFTYFLNNATNSIYKFSQSGLSTQITSSVLLIPRHSAYTYQSPFIYILGGSDKENPLRNDAVKIDIEQLQIHYLPTLPISSKHGDIYIQHNQIYYIGAVHIQNYSATPTPFLRLLENNNCWEVLAENSRNPKNFNISNNLLRPGTCKHENNLYLVGGEVFKSKTEKIFNTNVYCMDLNTLIVNILEFKGMSLGAPKCVYLNSGILVFGGYCEAGFNKEMWILGEKPMKINENCIKVSGNKVLHKINNYFATLGTKKMKKLSEEKLVWKEEKLNYDEILMKYTLGLANDKILPEAPRRVSIYPMYAEEDRSNLASLRLESRKHSPSNFFNSQVDFDLSQTLQQGTLREISGFNSIFEYSEYK